MDGKEIVKAYKRGETVKPEDVSPEVQGRFQQALFLRKYGLSPYGDNRATRRAQAAQRKVKR